MPIFNVKGKTLESAKLINFKSEKELQNLVENNLLRVFNCRFIATEFSTGTEHAGRIDTLALSEDNNPVIIEYKKEESSDLINQSLFYLSWINDHRGDFQIAVERVLKRSTEIDWSEIRVICIAPGYKKYDLHAVKAMGTSIELWQYKLFDNNTLYFEEVFRKSPYGCERALKRGKVYGATVGRRPPPQAPSYTFESHLKGLDKKIAFLATQVREYTLSLNESVEESPKKFYVSYKVAQNFLCLQTGKNKVTLYLKLDPKACKPMPPNGRDVSAIGHSGTGDLELSLQDENQLPEAQAFIKQAFDELGG